MYMYLHICQAPQVKLQGKHAYWLSYIAIILLRYWSDTQGSNLKLLPSHSYLTYTLVETF